jgi:hypothetical protein
MNISIAYGHLAMIELQNDQLELSRSLALKSSDNAEVFDYFRGVHMAGLILSEIEARHGNAAAAEKLLQKSLDGFASQKINEISKTDQDVDGLTDNQEKQYGTSPTNSDTDGDGLLDKDEIMNYKTDPLKADTDGDGMLDGSEVLRKRNPLQKN